MQIREYDEEREKELMGCCIDDTIQISTLKKANNN